MIKKSARLLAIWDVEQSLMSLGDLLVLLEDIKVLSRIRQLGYILDFVVLGEKSPHPSLLSLVAGMEGVEDLYFLPSGKHLRRFMDESQFSYVPWPQPDANGLIKHKYGFTSLIKSHFSQTGQIPYLSCKQEHCLRAKDFLQQHGQGKTPVVLHLKNAVRKSGKADWYNARFDAWVPFLQDMQARDDLMFFLIGNEPLPAEIKRLSNTVVTLDHGSNAIKDLALIQHAAAFMGVSSGPCNMAVFSPVPYVVFKTPGHHSEWVQAELGASNRFEFSTPSQLYLIEIETREALHREFQRLDSFLAQQVTLTASDNNYKLPNRYWTESSLPGTAHTASAPTT